MKAIYYDCFAGISGDMNLSALIDINGDGMWLNEIIREIFNDEVEIEFHEIVKKGIRAKKLHINEKKEQRVYRHLSDFFNLLEKTKLSSKVKNLARKIFTDIAEAEAKIHNLSVNEIHFHEIGGIDTFIDVVGGVLALERLGVEKVFSSSVEIGSGVIEISHGKFSVPAPATAELLKGVPVKQLAFGEATTPTGAAIIKNVVDMFEFPQNFSIEKIGYGAGERETEIPNVLRVFYGEIKKDYLLREKNVIIETNLDDMEPEKVDIVIDKLFEAGALDVYISQVIMKKSRPAFKITVLCDEDKTEKIEEILFRDTTTFGLRKFPVEKVKLKRKEEIIETSLGKIRVKTGILGEKEIKKKFEYEDLKRIAIEKKLTIFEILNELKKYCI
jgi:uncharacterized protein (TIGR00299 family) protein